MGKVPGELEALRAMDAQRESNGVIRALIPRGKRSETIGLADFSQGFRRKPNERARSKRAAVRSEQLVQHANSAGKTSISVARFSPIKSRERSGIPWKPHAGDRESGGWIEQSIFAGGVGSITGRVDRRHRRETSKTR